MRRYERDYIYRPITWHDLDVREVIASNNKDVLGSISLSLYNIRDDLFNHKYRLIPYDLVLGEKHSEYVIFCSFTNIPNDLYNNMRRFCSSYCFFTFREFMFCPLAWVKHNHFYIAGKEAFKISKADGFPDKVHLLKIKNKEGVEVPYGIKKLVMRE